MIGTLRQAADKLTTFLSGHYEPLSPVTFSRAIDCARVILVLGLTFIHYVSFPESTATAGGGIDPNAHGVATFTNSFVYYFLASGLRPLYALIAGWFFFPYDANPRLTLHRRIGKRLRSLLIPLVLWSSIYLLVLGILHHLNPDHPIFATFGFDFDGANPFDYVDAMVGVTNAPINYPFWFVRDLLVCVLISPILWWFLDNAPLRGALLVSLIWIGKFRMGIFMEPVVLAFFYFGGMLRRHELMVTVSKNTTIILVGLVLIYAALRALAPIYLPPSLSFDHFPLTLVARMSRLLCVVAFWSFFVVLARTSIGARIARYGGPSFFFFAAHALVLAQVKILLWPLLPHDTDAWMLTHYAASITLTIGSLFLLGIALSKFTPRFFALLTGGRVKVHTPQPKSAPVPAPAAVSSEGTA